MRPYAEHRTLGQLVRRCAEELGRDTLFLASGDLSHALTHGAPAPYDPRGKLFDDEVVSLLGVGDFAGLTRIEPILLEGAAECGLRSFVALGGFLGDDATVDPEILSYEGPFGVGYLVARFGPPGRRARARRDERPEPARSPGPADFALACVALLTSPAGRRPRRQSTRCTGAARRASYRSRSTASCAAASARWSRPRRSWGTRSRATRARRPFTTRVSTA